MPKKKTNKSAAKRVRMTATGKLKYARAGRGHLLQGKSRKRKRHMRRSGLLSAVEQKRIGLLISS